MKKQLLYLMFAAAVICAACGDDDEIINQIEVVENPVTGISVENEYITEEGDIVFDEVGITTTLRVSVIPGNAGDLEEYSFRFGSSNVGVFTVNREGVITGVASGEAELTVTLVDNSNVVRFQSKYRVAVDYQVKVEEIIVADGMGVLDLKVGDIYDLKPTLVVLPDNAEDKSVSYNLKEGDEVISLENGIIEVLAPGTAVIEIIANDGSSVSTELRVEAKGVSETDLFFESVMAGYQLPGSYLMLALLGNNNSLINIVLNKTALLPGEYSNTDIMTVVFNGVEGLDKNSQIDPLNPGSLTIQYDETTQKYTIKGVLNIAASASSPALTLGFEFVGDLIKM